MWFPKSFLSGHFESVNDLVWSPDSQYLVTVSSDQTCRLHAPVLSEQSTVNYNDNSCNIASSTTTAATHNDNADNISNDSFTDNTTNTNKISSHNISNKYMAHGPWREISRPQIHGYDLHSIAIAPSHSSYLLYSSADEKLLRVFDIPSCVMDGLSTLCGINRHQNITSNLNKNVPNNLNKNVPNGESLSHISNSSCESDTPQLCDSTNRVLRAYIPELGLSNRAAETMSSQEKYEQDARNVQGLDWSHAPLEGQLADYTVWPGEMRSDQIRSDQVRGDQMRSEEIR